MVATLAAPGAFAQPYFAPAQPHLPPAVPAFQCWDDVRFFSSLASGNFEYCRAHLRYAPGTLDCYQIIDRVCLVWLPGNVEWTEARNLRARLPIPCPEGPEPPVCRRLDLQ